MEATPTTGKKKGGRPRKSIKKDQLLGIKCTLIERKQILQKAQLARLSVSQYLLFMGLTGYINARQTVLPREALDLTTQLHHLRGLLNQIAKKRNGHDDLSPLDRSNLKILAATLDECAEKIQTFFK